MNQNIKKQQGEYPELEVGIGVNIRDEEFVCNATLCIFRFSTFW